VPLFTVSDLDYDGCDDVVLDWTDSLTPIQVFYGNSDGAVKRADVFEQKYNVRTVRQFEFTDLNEDGVQDIVGRTSPHGWKERELGIAWDADEPEFIALSRGKRSYKVLNSSYETYSHTGLLGDVDNDGITEIIQITEDPAKGTEIKIIDELKFITTGKTSINRSNHVIFDAEVGDLNNDGLLDTVITLSKSHKQHPVVTPEDANKIGTIAIYMGRPKTELNKIQPMVLGRHWMDQQAWRQYLSTKSAEAQTQAYAGTSNVELLDLDHDGDLEILVGYFVQANSSWTTSGMQIFENDNGNFFDATLKFLPEQPANRNLSQPTDLLYDDSLAGLNNDGKKDLILALRSIDSMTDPHYSSVFYLFKDAKYAPVLNDESLLADALKMQLIQSGDFNCDGKQDLIGLFAGIPDKENHYLKTLIAN
jgi:hypothetical protein